jgi:hypothetical protein
MVKQTKDLLAREQRIMPVKSFAVGDTGQFWVKDESDMAWRQVAATVKKTTTHSNIFLDNSLTIADASLELYATEFETMFSVLGANIGTFTDRNGDGKIAILLYDFNDTGSAATGFMAGYFWSKDYYEDAVAWQQAGLHSNEMDIIYIRGDLPLRWEETGIDFYENNLTTLVHEYQHCVHFGIKVWSQGDNGNYSATWIDEMMAMASETMYFKQKLQDNPAYTQTSMEGNGYLKDRIEYYSLDPRNSIRNGHGLTYWDRDGDVYSNYSLSYLFGQYLSLQASNGQAIFKAILDYMIANGVHDYQAVAAVASQYISGVNSWEAILKNFAIANVANQAGGLFGYKGAFALTAHGPTADTANIHNGGVVYRKISGAATVPAGAGSNIKFYDSNGTSIGSGSSATTTMGGGTGCTSELLFGGQSEETDLLRDFRDRVLRGSPAGEELIAIYYQHTDELSSIIMRDPLLRTRCTSLGLRMLPALTSAIEQKTLSLSTQERAELNSLCDAIIGQAGPDLAGLLRSLQNDFNQGSLFEDLGMDVSK